MTNRIDQPRALDLVGSPILVGGVGTGFEATLQYRVTEGHDEVTGHFMAGGGTGEHGQYQLQVDVAGAAEERRLRPALPRQRGSSACSSSPLVTAA